MRTAIAVLGFAILAASGWASWQGDTNGDRVTNGDDLAGLEQFLIGAGAISGRGDSNGDGIIDGGDAASLSAVIASNGTPFDVSDYFPLLQNSRWDYLDVSSGGGDDSFAWQVLGAAISGAGGRSGTRIQTIAVETTDDRHLSEDFWFVEPNGDLVFLGFHQEEPVGFLPKQDIILNAPLRFGGDGQQSGDVVTSSASATVQTDLGPVSGTVSSTTTYSTFIGAIETPLGTFRDLLRVQVSISVSAGIGGSIPLRTSTFFLKRGVGLVVIDQEPDQNDAQLELLSAATVGGTVISGDP